MTRFALLPDRILLADGFASGICVVIDHGIVASLTPAALCPAEIGQTRLDGTLVPGFIDLQVNGGGGVLFNDNPTIESIAAIAKAHRAFGTTGMLPTLISDELDIVRQAIAAVDQAILDGVPGILGIHLEGPFLNAAKNGIHDKGKFRALDEHALDLLSSLKHGTTLVTLAPECTTPAHIRELADRGVIVAAGHTAATFEEAVQAAACGMTGFTHLFNAMMPLAGRAPGVIGAALDTPESWCSIIADGHHVHPANLRLALSAKGPGKIVLVTDAMPSVGSAERTFRIGDTPISVRDGRCVAADGTLAGAHLDMASAVRNATEMLRIAPEVAIAMATANPAKALGLTGSHGSIRIGSCADFALLDEAGAVRATWIGGAGCDLAAHIGKGSVHEPG